MRSHLFSPDSVFWRVNRENLVALAGSRALLLELAHPLVAAGVARHSDFQRDSLGRFVRTMRTMTNVMYGDLAAASRSAQHVQRCHAHVAGRLAHSAGPYLAGTPYYANDPLLRLWVLATLIDSVLLVYESFVAPLSDKDKESYYRDSRIVARVLGIPSACLPPTYDDFLTYMDAMLTSDLLTVGEDARAIVAALYAPPLLGALTRMASFAGIGLLPERLRADFGFAWDARRERWLRRLAAFSRGARPWLPEMLCVSPQALAREWQERRASTLSCRPPL